MKIILPFILALDPMAKIEEKITELFTDFTNWIVNGLEAIVSTITDVIVNTIFYSITSFFQMIKYHIMFIDSLICS